MVTDPAVEVNVAPLCNRTCCDGHAKAHMDPSADRAMFGNEAQANSYFHEADADDSDDSDRDGWNWIILLMESSSPRCLGAYAHRVALLSAIMTELAVWCVSRRLQRLLVVVVVVVVCFFVLFFLWLGGW